MSKEAVLIRNVWELPTKLLIVWNGLADGEERSFSGLVHMLKKKIL